jgi:hypothetical protein
LHRSPLIAPAQRLTMSPSRILRPPRAPTSSPSVNLTCRRASDDRPHPDEEWLEARLAKEGLPWRPTPEHLAERQRPTRRQGHNDDGGLERPEWYRIVRPASPDGASRRLLRTNVSGWRHSWRWGSPSSCSSAATSISRVGLASPPTINCGTPLSRDPRNTSLKDGMCSQRDGGGRCGGSPRRNGLRSGMHEQRAEERPLMAHLASSAGFGVD